MKRISVLFFILFSFFGCVSYNPNYMASRTTQERIVDVAVLVAFGVIIGASTTIEIMEP